MSRLQRYNRNPLLPRFDTVYIVHRIPERHDAVVISVTGAHTYNEHPEGTACAKFYVTTCTATSLQAFDINGDKHPGELSNPGTPQLNKYVVEFVYFGESRNDELFLNCLGIF